MHASVAARGRVAAVLTILLGGTQPGAAPLALLRADGTVPLVEIRAGDAVRAGKAGTGEGWREARPGLEWTELELRGQGEARQIRVIVARLDPAKFTLSLENGMAPGGFMHVWNVDMAPKDAALALNAGMFEGDGAWGWVVHAGKEYRTPRTGPLARAVVIDSLGAVRLADDAQVERLRAAGLRGITEAFQSYPMLLENGKIPAVLDTPTEEMDLAHRDARLAVGIDPDGRLIVALTRFDVLGPSFGSVPFGLTISETALLMRSLGAESAVALDGGISAQLLLREAGGVQHTWPGLRTVPLGLSAVAR